MNRQNIYVEIKGISEVFFRAFEVVLLEMVGWLVQWLASLLSARKVWGSIPGSVKSDVVANGLTTAATFLRSRLAHALSRGDGSRQSLHASV